MHSEVITNVWLMARMLGKVALYTGAGPGIAAILILTRYPAVAGRCARSLMAVRRFWQELPQNIAGRATNGNRVSQKRSAQRRLDDLTKAGAPSVRVEAPQLLSFPFVEGDKASIRQMACVSGLTSAQRM